MKNKLTYIQYSFDLFNVDYTFYHGNIELLDKFVKKHFNVILEHIPGFNACAFMLDSNIGIFLPNDLDKTECANTLVHECVHASWYLQEQIGNIFNTDAQETQCYIVQRLFKDGMKFYKGKFK